MYFKGAGKQKICCKCGLYFLKWGSMEQFITINHLLHSFLSSQFGEIDFNSDKIMSK